MFEPGKDFVVRMRSYAALFGMSVEAVLRRQWTRSALKIRPSKSKDPFQEIKLTESCGRSRKVPAFKLWRTRRSTLTSTILNLDGQTAKRDILRGKQLVSFGKIWTVNFLALGFSYPLENFGFSSYRYQFRFGFLPSDKNFLFSSSDTRFFKNLSKN